MEMKSLDIDILAITQTTLRGEVQENFQEYSMIGKGREKFARQGGGVGIIYKHSKGRSIEQIDINKEEIEGEDIAVFKSHGLKGKEGDFILIVCYMTVEGPNAIENNAKYKILQDLVRNFQSERVIVVGDMNGHTGILGERSNGNGNRLLDFAEVTDLEILNHTIAEGRVTWSNGNIESAIDYILVNKKAREMVISMNIDEEGDVNIQSDHNVLILNYGCSREVKSKVTKGKGKSGYKWILKDVTFDDFQIDLAELDQLYPINNAANMNDNLTKKINSTATKNFRKVKIKGKNKHRNKIWWNKEIDQAIQERKQQNRVLRRLGKQKKRGLVDEDEYNRGWANYERAKDKASTDILSKLS